jgi:hypothetical protein
MHVRIDMRARRTSGSRVAADQMELAVDNGAARPWRGNSIGGNTIQRLAAGSYASTARNVRWNVAGALFATGDVDAVVVRAPATALRAVIIGASNGPIGQCRSYTSTMSVLLARVMKALPMRPPR